jgi:hypothetical protein
MILHDLEKDFQAEVHNLDCILQTRMIQRNIQETLGDTDGLTLRTRVPQYYSESDLKNLQGKLNRCKKILSKYGKELRKLST